MPQANSGAALGVRQRLSLTPSASGSLHVTPVINGVVGAATDVMASNPGDDVSLLPGQMSSLSIIPEIDLKGIVRDQADLVVNGNVDVKALGSTSRPCPSGRHQPPRTPKAARPGVTVA